MGDRCSQIGLSVAALILGVGCSRSALTRDPFPPVTPSQIQRPLSVNEIRDDLEELVALVEATTPQPYLRVDRGAVRAQFDRLARSVDRPMTRREVLGLIKEAYATYAIAHLYVLTPYEDFNAWAASGGRVLSVPLRVEAQDAHSPAARRLVVARDADGLRAGDEIVRISGRDVQNLLATFGRRTSSETEAYRTRQMTGGLADHLWSMGLEAPYLLETADGRTLTDHGKTPPPRVSPFARRDGRSTAAPARTDFELRWIEPDIALIRWTAMDPRRSAEWEAFLTASFTDIVRRPAAGVVIDIRDNGGGSSQLARALLGHVTAEPYRFAGGKLWRKSAAYDRFLESAVVGWARGLPWRKSFSAEYAAMKIAEERQLSSDAPRPAPRREPAFDGPVVLLIGPGTFSSAAMVADAAVTYRLMPVLGSPTGGVPSSHGEIGFHRLGNSGLIVSFCSALFLRASGDVDDVGPVVPTHATGGQGVRDGHPFDEDLAAAVRWIRSDTGQQSTR